MVYSALKRWILTQRIRKALVKFFQYEGRSQEGKAHVELENRFYYSSLSNGINKETGKEAGDYILKNPCKAYMESPRFSLHTYHLYSHFREDTNSSTTNFRFFFISNICSTFPWASYYYKSFRKYLIFAIVSYYNIFLESTKGLCSNLQIHIKTLSMVAYTFNDGTGEIERGGYWKSTGHSD